MISSFPRLHVWYWIFGLGSSNFCMCCGAACLFGAFLQVCCVSWSFYFWPVLIDIAMRKLQPTPRCTLQLQASSADRNGVVTGVEWLCFRISNCGVIPWLVLPSGLHYLRYLYLFRVPDLMIINFLKIILVQVSPLKILGIVQISVIFKNNVSVNLL